MMPEGLLPTGGSSRAVHTGIKAGQPPGPIERHFPLTQLPNELISEVFKASVSIVRLREEDEADLNGFRDIPLKARQSLTLSSISHDLRRIALTTPSLWIYMFEVMHPDGIDSFAVRSGGCLLHVRIVADTSAAEWSKPTTEDIPHARISPQTFQRLCQHSSRWGSIYITGNVTKTLRQYAASLPKLQSLDVATDYRQPAPSPMTALTTWGERLASWDMPNVSSYRGYFVSSAPIDASRVTKLGIIVRMPSTEALGAKSTEQLSAFLASAKMLKELSLKFDRDTGGSRSGFVVAARQKTTTAALPHLHTLVISSTGPTGLYSAVFKSLRMPNLRIASLKLSEPFFEEALLQVAESKHISTLELIGGFPRWHRHVSVVPLTTIFHNMPSLQKLETKNVRLDIQTGQAPDGSKAPLNPVTIPVSLSQVICSDLIMRLCDLEALLVSFRYSTAWKHLAAFKLDIADVCGESPSQAFMKLVAECGSKVDIRLPQPPPPPLPISDAHFDGFSFDPSLFDNAELNFERDFAAWFNPDLPNLDF